MNLTIEVRGLEEVERSLEAIPGELDEEIFPVLRQAGMGVKQRAQALAPVGATGNLRKGIRLSSSRRTLTVKVRSRARHAHIVTKGRRPGKMPPPTALTGWAALRGLAGKEFALARAIGRAGTKPVAPFLGPAAAGADAEVREGVRAAIAIVLARHRTG